MKTKLKLFLISTFANTLLNAQNEPKTITGFIRSENTAEAIYGANIKVKETGEESTSDTDGRFSIITNSPYPFTLIIKATQHKTSEFIVEKETNDIIFEIEGLQQVLNEIVVSGRRRKELLQDIPIPVTVISGHIAENAGAFNVNRLKELIPSVQLYSSNARNTTLNIRGLGSTFGLTNDGIDPGVGFYIDGVYHARPAATALDFVDVDQIEILRGPQGTLFGKNTTAGAFNITSKKPSETVGARAELSYGNYNYFQAKTTVTGPIATNLYTRISFSGTQRNGTIFNVNDQQRYNGLNNIGVKGQLLYTPSSKLEFHLIGDYNKQQPDGSSLVIAGVTPTLRNAYRQYYKIIEDLGYDRPLIDPFARKIYTNTPYRHDQDAGGASFNINYKIGYGTLTSTSAWRFWNWDPVNDRDFSEVAALTKSQAPSHHDQFSQEIRYAGNITKKISGTIGVFALNQILETSPYHEEEVGPDQWRFLQTSSTGSQALYATPGLLDNFGIRTYSKLESLSTAAFGQIDWNLFKGLHLIGGLRYNYDKKTIAYDRQTYGGLQTTDPALLALKKAVYTNQQFNTSTNNTNLSGNATLAYKPNNIINLYATYSTAYKPVGVNLGGLPTTQLGDPDLSLAIIKPEFVQHTEIGIKTKPTSGAILNVTAFNTDIKDYQTNVQSPQLGVNRGYLANAEKVNVRGIEVDASYRLKNFLTVNGALAYTDGKYVKFTNAPLALEETGKTSIDANGATVQQAFTDVSGGRLPGISKWNATLGFELSTEGNFIGTLGQFFIAADASYRSEYSSNPTPSSVLNVDGYALINPRIGFRSNQFSFIVWSRNVTNTNYFEQLQAAAGNSGLYAGVLGDPRTYGLTIRYNY
jgi:iron complex outermembrane receptor protein